MPRFESLPIRLVLVAVGAWLAGAPAAYGQTFIPAPNQGFSADLDTMEGSYSVWIKRDLGSLSALHATIEVARLGKGGRWVPAFGFWVLTGDGKGRKFGVQVIAEAWASPMPAYTSLEGKPQTNLHVRQKIALGQKTDLDMDWGTPGKLLYRFGDANWEEVPLPSEVRGIEISASSGELDLQSVVLGSFSHPDSEAKPNR
jgi:hypothetical protein